MSIPDRVAQRVLSQVAMGPNGCHISTRASGARRRPYVTWQEESGRWRGCNAARAAWTGVHGQIPDDLTVDHVCRETRCINVNHLRLLTASENSKRNHQDFELGRSCRGNHDPGRRRTNSKGQSICLDCQADRVRRWRSANPELARERTRQSTAKWRKANPEKNRERLRAEYLKRRDAQK